MNTIKVGSVVRFNEVNYITLEDRGSLVLVLGQHDGNWIKKQVNKNNILVSEKVPMMEVKHTNGTSYLVSTKGTIISLKTYSVMKWGSDNGDRRAILIQAKKQGMVFIK